MFPLILLQTVAEHTKPAAVAIAEGGGSVIQPVLLSLATGLAGFFLRSLVFRPTEKVEAYEQARIQAIENQLKEHKDGYARELADWKKWREEYNSRVITLEQQTKNAQDTLLARVKDLSIDIAETKALNQEIREKLAVLTSQMDSTINKWSK